MAISSILLLSATRFLPGLQQAIRIQEQQRGLEEEVWLRISAIGKQLQRAGYCDGECQGQGVTIGNDGQCVIVQWDANSNGRWETSPLASAEQTGFRLKDGALETLRGASSCEGKGWDKLTDPQTLIIQRFQVQKNVRAEFAPAFSIGITAALKGRPTASFQTGYHVSGFNL